MFSRKLSRKSSFERLEDRRVLATLTVSLATDAQTPVEDGKLTLREAIQYINEDFIPLPDEFSPGGTLRR